MACIISHKVDLLNVAGHRLLFIKQNLQQQAIRVGT